MADYVTLAREATATIREDGAALTVARTEIDSTVSGYTWFVVFEKQEKYAAPAAAFGAMQNVQVGDWKLLVAAFDATDAPVTPREGDLLDINGETFAVVHFEPIQPGGIPVAFYAWARRA